MLGFHGLSVTPISALENSGAAQGSITVSFSTEGILAGQGRLFGLSNITFSVAASVTSFFSHSLIGAHEYYPWHNKDGLTLYFGTKWGKARRARGGRIPTDQERDDVLVRKRIAITATTTTELNWDIYNFFDVSVAVNPSIVFLNPRDNSDFVVLLTKDANATVRTISWPVALLWPDGNQIFSLTTSGETKLIRVSYFGGVYRATLY